MQANQELQERVSKLSEQKSYEEDQHFQNMRREMQEQIDERYQHELTIRMKLEIQKVK